jgi:NAD(P)-dependent dehydrogenase (short-subunit alcohol dehydrogenase family)
MLRQVFGSDEVLDEMAGIHPVRRIGFPEDVADAVAWLFSDYSSYYTGQSLVLDGGLTAQRPFMRPAVMSANREAEEGEKQVVA